MIAKYVLLINDKNNKLYIDYKVWKNFKKNDDAFTSHAECIVTYEGSKEDLYKMPIVFDENELKEFSHKVRFVKSTKIKK